jgi:hypothetical protein
VSLWPFKGCWPDLDAFLNDLSPACRPTRPAHFFAVVQKTVDKQCGVGVFDTC